MSRPRQNPRIPEGINASQEHPLKEFSVLFIAVSMSLVLLVVVLSIAAQQLAAYIPFRWEERITQFDSSLDPSADEQEKTAELRAESTADVNPELNSDLKSELKSKLDPELTQEPAAKQQSDYDHAQLSLQALVENLSASMVLPSDMHFKVHLLQDDMPNAFATLGGHIFVTEGLLAVVSSENALAMVLAHEMAHIKFRHPIQAMSRGALLQLIVALVSGSQGGVALNSVLGQTGLMTLLSFNRDMERESDTEAMAVLTQHYGHLVGADEFFSEVLARHGDAGWRAAFETHPGTQERLNAIAEQVGKLGVRQGLNQGTQQLTTQLTDQLTDQQSSLASSAELTPLPGSLLAMKAQDEPSNTDI